MKNLHLLPTDKPSRLHLWTDKNGTRLELCELEYSHTRNTQHIYITSDEEIKEGDWFNLDMSDNDRPDEIHQMGTNKRSKTGGINFSEPNSWTKSCKKIILTTDQDLIKDGVQTIDDEFLEWFVKNPSCEYVEVEPIGYASGYNLDIPKKEPKQETVEKAAEIELGRLAIQNSKRFASKSEADYTLGFIQGAKLQAERMYSEEDMRKCWNAAYIDALSIDEETYKPLFFEDFIEQFKKK